MSDNELLPARRSPWHIYPHGWKPNHWLVPYEGEQALIHHGHNQANDHSRCGPMVFCCARAQQVFIGHFPNSQPAKANWGLTEAEHIHAWLEAGVNVLYFIFCDPVSPRGLLAGGLSGEQARQVLFREVLVEQYSDNATRLV